MSAERTRPRRRIGVVAKVGSPEALHTAQELAEWLRRRDLEVILDAAVLKAQGLDGETPFNGRDSFDLVVVLGGDGTLLSVARGLTSGVPILGVNLGNLGFLTEINRGELYPSLVEVLEGRFETEERALLDVELRRSGGEELRRSGGDASTFRVLNDAVVTKSARARIIQLTLEVDGHLIARYRSDGLIISTPTGSTAYNLSAGGPIVHPMLPVVLLTPICPHALSVRPIVVPSSSRIEVALATQGEEVYLTLDGQEGTPLHHRDSVRVTRSAATARLVKVSSRSFYDNLCSKLRWGGLPAEEPKPPSS